MTTFLILVIIALCLSVAYWMHRAERAEQGLKDITQAKIDGRDWRH